MKGSIKKAIIAVVIVAACVLLLVLLSMRKVEDFHEKYAGVDLNQDVEGMERAGTYAGYMNSHADAALAKEDVDIDIFNYSSTGDVSVYENYEGVDKALFTEVDSTVAFDVNVPLAALLAVSETNII